MELEDSYVIQSSFMWSEAEIMVCTYFSMEQYFQEVVVTCTTLLNRYQLYISKLETIILERIALPLLNPFVMPSFLSYSCHFSGVK